MGTRTANAKNLYLDGIRDGKINEAVNKYTGDFYKQHSTGVKDGKEGFIEFFEPFIIKNKKKRYQINMIQFLLRTKNFLKTQKNLKHSNNCWNQD